MAYNDNTYGALPSSFVFTPGDVIGPNPANQPLVYMNTNVGVPPNEGVGSTTGGGGQSAVSDAVAYAGKKSNQPPARGPLIWLFGGLMLSVAILGGFAHKEVRRL
jgi:hypothetical protein